MINKFTNLNYIKSQISIYYLYICIQKILQVSKRKEYLAKTALIVVEDNKYCKDIRHIKKIGCFKYDKEKKTIFETSIKAIF